MKRKIVCKFCGNVFFVNNERKNNAIKYCSDNCRQNAKREQNLKAQHKFQKKYRWLFKDADKNGRLGEARIGIKPKEDFEEEYKEVHKELCRVMRDKQ